MKDSTSTRRPTPQTRVLCVDDNADMVDMMRMMIDAEPTMRCVGCLNSADRLLQTVLDMDPPPEVILLDATMPGEDPLTVLKLMAEKSVPSKTIVFSGHDDVAFVDRVKRAGAWGFVSKRDEPDAILLAVREVAAGRAFWPRPPSAS